nr:MAG TPA: hypothetical protein [Caudoviricetes sp.]
MQYQNSIFLNLFLFCIELMFNLCYCFFERW